MAFWGAALGFLGGALLGSSGGGGGGGGGQADSEEAREYYRESAGLTREQANILRESRPLLKEQEGLIREQAATSRELRGMAREQWDIYKKNALPALREFGEKVRGYASKGRVRQQEGMAAADVRSAYASRRKEFMSSLGRYGVRPGSGRFASSLRALALGEAGDVAGAKTRTRTGILDRDLSNYAGLAAAWQGRDSSAMTGAAQSAAGLGAAGVNLGSGYSRYAAGLGNAAGGMARVGGGFGSMGIAGMQGDAITQSGLYSGLGSLVGSLGGAAILKYSDARLKDNIVQIGELSDGIKVYEFNYIDDYAHLYTGVVAQELIEIRPHLVGAIDGYLAVDYDALINEELRMAA